MGNGPCSTSPDVYTLHHQSHKSTKERTRVIAIKVIGQKFFVPLPYYGWGVYCVLLLFFYPPQLDDLVVYQQKKKKFFFFGSSKVNGSLGIGISSRVVSSTRTGNSKNAPLVFFWCCFVRAVEWYIYVYIKEGGRIFLFQFLFPYNLLIGRR